ncbi:inorganic phosphate transporter [Candidatus Protochlamydia phocaeensis]|uniref:inorganic phosphate transporter n=1 Tax=Candidatus Protochlamydia phocaeensis TaxID=1414722 RepID=UPI0009ADCC82|nr:inorganic phosphate transporter [Candidatus Protochlamydia phocaeensis]
MDFLLLSVVILLILVAEFLNGCTDAPNAIATVVSTRTLSLRIALILATTLNILGAFSGTAVATTIGKSIVQPEAINLTSMGAAMLAIIFWSLFTWRFGLPMSKSHALVASLSGAGLALAGPSALIWEGWAKVLIGLLLSTMLGALGGWILAKFIQSFFSRSHPASAKKTFMRLQLLSSSLMAYSHGSNDSQKFMGAFSLALLIAGLSSTFYVPYWVILICALTMGCGTAIGGMRIIKTVGFKVVHLESYQGFAAETSAASTILLASFFGIPLSTTHTINTAIIGVGLARHKKLVHWNVFFSIVAAWVMTFPVCGIIAYFSAFMLQAFELAGLPILIFLFLGVVYIYDLFLYGFSNWKMSRFKI